MAERVFLYQEPQSHFRDTEFSNHVPGRELGDHLRNHLVL